MAVNAKTYSQKPAAVDRKWIFEPLQNSPRLCGSEEDIGTGPKRVNRDEQGQDNFRDFENRV